MHMWVGGQLTRVVLHQVVEIKATYNPDTRAGNTPEGMNKVKGIIQVGRSPCSEARGRLGALGLCAGR